jgi:hypothetical protein
MSIEKQMVIDQISVNEDGVVHVRAATRIFEDGKLIGQSYHRHLVAPGADYSAEDTKVQAVCAAAHTPEVIDAYQAAIAAQGV